MARATGSDSPLRGQLIEAAVAWVAEQGFADVSLRQLAAALGTSHRMLIYHFGSKDGLFVEVIRAFESQQRAGVERMATAGAGTELEQLRRVWAQVSAADTLRQVRLFFQVCGHALGNVDQHDAMADSLAAIVGDWVGPLLAVERRHRGSTAEVARADLRVGIAVMRGLLLDLLATGDRAGVDLAFERYATTWVGRSARDRRG